MTWLHCRPPTRGTQVKDKEAEAAAATAAASARGGREKDLPAVRVFCRGLGGGGELEEGDDRSEETCLLLH